MKVLTNQIPNYHFDDLKKIESGYWWFEGRLMWAKEFVKEWLEENHFTESIFYADLGSGTGGLANALHNHFSFEKTLLVDNNDEALKRVKSVENVNQVKIDLVTDYSLPFSPNLVTCMDLIEHIQDDNLVLEKIYTHLKPGGLLVLSVPAHPFLYSSWDSSLGHYRRYSKGSLVRKLRQAGFKIRRVSYGWSYLLPAAPYRFLFPKRQETLRYPRVPEKLNQFLIKASGWECKLSRVISIPFGTSLFISASKD